MQTKENDSMEAASSESEIMTSADLEMTGSSSGAGSASAVNKSGGNLKTMLEEVLRNGASTSNSTVDGMSSSVAKNSLTTYIRDAARFTELTSSHSEEHCTTSASVQAATIPIPTSEKTKLSSTILKKKEEDDLDLD